MQALRLPASHGWYWLAEGFVIFRRKPALLIFLVLGYWLLVLAVTAIPLIGQLAGFLLIPALSVSLMNACRLIDRKENPPPRVLFSGLHHNLQTLFMLGAIQFMTTLAIFGLSSMFDGGVLFRVLVMGEELALDPTEISFSMQAIVVMAIPLTLAFWFAPVLAAWHDMSAGKSLFFSLVACLRNWRPFLLYALGVALIGVFIPRLLVGLLRVSNINQVLPQGMVAMTVSLILLPTLYASFYIGYRDIFVSKPDVS